MEEAFVNARTTEQLNAHAQRSVLEYVASPAPPAALRPRAREAFRWRCRKIPFATSVRVSDVACGLFLYQVQVYQKDRVTD